MLLGPELAIASLDALAALQAREDDPSIDAEPGKILHELRRGRAAETWFGTYYGTVDATPLYLILLSEVWRWTRRSGGRRAAARAGARRAALDRRVRRPRRRRVRRVRAPDAARAREPVVEGLRATRSASTTARTRRPRSHRSRCRGTSTTRSCGSPSSPAPSGPTRRSPPASRTEAAELRRRFDEQFWVEERGGYYALALDGDKRRVDSLCSNIGHLLWSGIVPPERRRRDREPADGRRALVGEGDPDDVDRGRRLQPAHLPQRHRLAPRHVARRLGPVAKRPCRRRRPDRADAVPVGSVLRVVAAGGLRRLPPRGDAVPDRVPDRGPAAGVGRRNARADAAAPARHRARPALGPARHGCDRPRVAGRARAQRRPRARAARGASPLRTAASARRLPEMRVAVLSPVWFPVPPSGYGGIEWIVVAARRRPRRRGPRRHPLRVGRLAHARKAGGGLRGGARATGSARPSGSSSTPSTASPGTTTST